MNSKNCIDKVNVPTVDNTENKCDNCGYVDMECIISDISYPAFGKLSGESLKELLSAIEIKYIKMVKKINELELRIASLE